MEFVKSARIPAPCERVCAFMQDLGSVGQCVPGVESMEAVGEDRYRGAMRIKVGPIALKLEGELALEERDASTGTTRMHAEAADKRVGGSIAQLSRTLLNRSATSFTEVRRMPRFMVERTFPDGLAIPTNEDGRQTTARVAARNAELGVTWVHSYVTPDHRKTYCIYDGPNEDAIRQAAERNGLPVDSVTPVSVLDPYFYNV